MNIKWLTSVIATAFLVVGGFLLYTYNSPIPEDSVSTPQINNVSLVDGKQIIEISARAGFSAKQSQAKAGIPTIIRFQTSNTFDCSASVQIPDLNISKTLPPTGTTDLDIGTQQPGNLTGTCSMGMYTFNINFAP